MGPRSSTRASRIARGGAPVRLTCLALLTLFAAAACSEKNPLLPDMGGPQRLLVDNPAMCGVTTATDFIAGQKLTAGSVEVSNDETTVYVKLTTTDGWVLKESHVAVASTLAGIPTNKPGMPEPGRFPLKASHPAGTTTYTYTLPRGALLELKTFYVAAHADVQRGSQQETAWGSGTPFVAKGSWAMYFTVTLNPCQGVVKGRVLDAETQAPISAAAVKLSSPAELTTGENGTFVFDPVHIGGYVLDVTHGAFHPVTIDPVAVTKNQTTDLGDILLHAKKGVITGRVVDELSDAPIGGATVAVSNATGTLQTLTTAADGTFTTDSLRIGAYSLLVTNALHHPLLKEGVAVASLELTNVGDLKLPPLLGEVRGTVVDQFNGAPLEGVAITLTGTNGFSYTGVTAMDGTFAIGGVRIGTYDAAFSIADFDPAAVNAIAVAAGAPQELGIIRLRPHTGIFSVDVGDSEDGPIADAKVRVLDANGVQVVVLTTPPQGPATFELRIGSYTATASATNFVTSAPVPFSLTHGVTTSRTILLEPEKGGITGWVVDAENGQPITGSVEVRIGTRVIQTRSSGADGGFAFDGLRVGTYSVYATAPNYFGAGRANIVVAASQNTNIGNLALAPHKGAIHGVVSDAENGAKIYRATVRLSAGGVVVSSAITDPNGAFDITALRVGSYTLDVTADHFVAASTGVTVTVNATATPAIALIPVKGGVTGRIVDAETLQPVAGTVQLTVGGGARTQLTGSDGVFTFTDLRVGSYPMRITAVNYAERQSTAVVEGGAPTSAGDQPLTPFKGAIRGTIVDAETQQPIDGTFTIKQGATVIVSGNTVNGFFGVGGLRIGTYTVGFTAPEHVAREVTGVTVNANATTELGNVPMDPQRGTVVFQVREAGSNAAISGATVIVYSGATQVASLTTAADGNVQVLLRIGTYTANVSAAGHLSAALTGIVVTAGQSTTHTASLVVPNGSAQGTVVNAVNNVGFSGATVEFLAGGVNGPVVATVTSGAGGAFGPVALAPGSYTARASASGFVTATTPVTVNPGATTYIGTIALSPVMPAGQWRIVLTWGSYPNDLDSHLTGPIPNDGRFHVAYYAKSLYGSALDVDDVSGYGPETITIGTQNLGIYRYSVQNYTNRYSPGSTYLANSGAVVTVYHGASQVAQFTVPNAAGTLWTVFEINGDVLTPVNAMSNQSDPTAIARVLRGRQVVTDEAVINAAVEKNPKK